MIDIPLGKALIAVEVEDDDYDEKNKCDDCCFTYSLSCLPPVFMRGGFCDCDECNKSIFDCNSITRKDGKNVIFKLVDYQETK